MTSGAPLITDSEPLSALKLTASSDCCPPYRERQIKSTGQNTQHWMRSTLTDLNRRPSYGYVTILSGLLHFSICACVAIPEVFVEWQSTDTNLEEKILSQVKIETAMSKSRDFQCIYFLPAKPKTELPKQSLISYSIKTALSDCQTAKTCNVFCVYFHVSRLYCFQCFAVDSG